MRSIVSVDNCLKLTLLGVISLPGRFPYLINVFLQVERICCSSRIISTIRLALIALPICIGFPIASFAEPILSPPNISSNVHEVHSFFQLISECPYFSYFHFSVSGNQYKIQEPGKALRRHTGFVEYSGAYHSNCWYFQKISNSTIGKALDGDGTVHGMNSNDYWSLTGNGQYLAVVPAEIAVQTAFATGPMAMSLFDRDMMKSVLALGFDEIIMKSIRVIDLKHFNAYLTNGLRVFGTVQCEPNSNWPEAIKIFYNQNGSQLYRSILYSYSIDRYIPFPENIIITRKWSDGTWETITNIIHDIRISSNALQSADCRPGHFRTDHLAFLRNFLIYSNDVITLFRAGMGIQELTVITNTSSLSLLTQHDPTSTHLTTIQALCLLIGFVVIIAIVANYTTRKQKG